jgi:small-conductance mechanosensitive channel
MDDLIARAQALLRASSALEWWALVACLLGSFAVAWAGARRRPDAHSIWFGERVVDGVLFPLLAFSSTWAAKVLLTPHASVKVLGLAQVMLASLAIIRVGVRVLHVALPGSGVVRTAERTLSWVVWLCTVAWLAGVLPVLLQELEAVKWRIGGANVDLRTLLEGALTALAVMLGVLWVSASIEAALLKGTELGNLSARKMAANALRAVLLLVGLLLALSSVGIPLSALSVLGGAVGVGVGLGLQKLASNYVSGFVILAERSIRIGDMVKVDGFEGVIADIKTRYSVLRALSGRESIVPNEMLITQRVENATLADTKVVLQTVLQVAYGTDVPALTPALEAAMSSAPRVLAQPAPAVHLTQFAADGLELTLNYWIGDPQNGTNNVRSDVNLAVLAALTAAGVEVPFPQRVVHQKPAL